MRLPPRREDQLMFVLLGLVAVVMFIVMIRALPARGHVDPFGLEANSDLHATTYEETADWVFLVDKYFDDGDFDRAMEIIQCESGGDPNAKNPRSTASGAFQHLASMWPDRSVKAGWAGYSVFDPEANVAVAAWLVYEGGGWSHWNASKSCWGSGGDWVEPVTVDLVTSGRPARR